VVPCAGGCIGIVADQDKTPRSARRVRPLQRWRDVFSIAGEAPLRRRTRLKRASWLSPSGCRRHWLALDEFLRNGLDLTRSAALRMKLADAIARERNRVAAV
jgi:hypothetical protein